MKKDIVSWLVNCPASDINFDLKLKEATQADVDKALGSQKLSKTARRKIESRARALQRAQRKGTQR